MKIQALLLVALCAAAVEVRAQPSGTASKTPGPAAGPFAAVNAAIDKFRLAVDQTQKCFDGERVLRQDHDRARARYSAEFKGGKLPDDYAKLLLKKADRMRAAHDECMRQHKELGKMYDWVMQVYGSVEPKSLNLTKQKELIQKHAERYRAMAPRGPGAKGGADQPSEQGEEQ